MSIHIYWRLKDVPELASLGPKERRRVHELCLRRHFLYTRPTRRSLAAFAAMLCCPISVGILGSDLLARVPSSAPFPYDIAAMTIGAMFGWFVFTRIAIPYLRPFYSNFVESEL